MWTQEQLRDLTTEKVIEEHLTLFQIKQHYEMQNVDPPAELLADLELLNEEIKTQFGLIKIILNCIKFQFFVSYSFPKHSQCIKPLQYLCWPCF